MHVWRDSSPMHSMQVTSRARILVESWLSRFVAVFCMFYLLTCEIDSLCPSLFALSHFLTVTLSLLPFLPFFLSLPSTHTHTCTEAPTRSPSQRDTLAEIEEVDEALARAMQEEEAQRAARAHARQPNTHTHTHTPTAGYLQSGPRYSPISLQTSTHTPASFSHTPAHTSPFSYTPTHTPAWMDTPYGTARFRDVM